jgi:hypothetical protein
VQFKFSHRAHLSDSRQGEHAAARVPKSRCTSTSAEGRGTSRRQCSQGQSGILPKLDRCREPPSSKVLGYTGWPNPTIQRLLQTTQPVRSPTATATVDPEPLSEIPCLISICFLRPCRVAYILSQPVAEHSNRFDLSSCTIRRCSARWDPWRNSVGHCGQRKRPCSTETPCTATA